MKLAIELSIRIFWGFFGALCAFSLIQEIWSELFCPHPVHGSVSLFLVALCPTLALIVFFGYLAIFRFSSLLIRPTALVVSLILWFTFSWAMRVYLQPAIERDVRLSNFSIMPLLGIAASILSIVAAIGFYRATSKVLERQFSGGCAGLA